VPVGFSQTGLLAQTGLLLKPAVGSKPTATIPPPQPRRVEIVTSGGWPGLLFCWCSFRSAWRRLYSSSTKSFRCGELPMMVPEDVGRVATAPRESPMGRRGVNGGNDQRPPPEWVLLGVVHREFGLSEMEIGEEDARSSTIRFECTAWDRITLDDREPGAMVVCSDGGPG